MSGLPFSVATLWIAFPDDQGLPTFSGIGSVKMSGSRVAWMPRTGDDLRRRLIIRDLITGTVKTLHSPERSNIYNYALNDEILAFVVESGRLCVDGPQGFKHAQLPSAGAPAIAVDQRTVALIQLDSSTSPLPNSFIILYDYDARRMRTVVGPTLKRGHWGASKIIRVDAAGEVIDLLAIEEHDGLFGSRSVELSVLHIRCDFQGAELLRSAWTREIHSSSDYGFARYDALQPTGICGLFRATPSYQTREGMPSSGHSPIIYFDAKSAKVGGGEDFGMPRNISEHSAVLQWKGRHYRTRPPLSYNSLYQNSASAADTFEFPMTASLPPGHNDSTLHAAMNESFIVGLRQTAPLHGGRNRIELVAACFDESIMPPNFRKTYLWDVDGRGA